MKRFYFDQLPMPFTRACVDTRKLERDDLFFALTGAKTDGHHFLQEAASKGASLLVIKKSYPTEQKFACPILRVDDPLEMLHQMAKEAISRLAPKTVAITGSFGKTTTKEFLVQILSPYRRVLSTAGTQNSQIGLPVSLLNSIQGDESHCVVEMGLTEAGHIAKLVELVPPDLAVITALAPVHIAQFENMQALARAKFEIFSNPRTKTGLISKECAQYQALLERLVSFGTYSLQAIDADWRLQVERDHLLVQNGEDVVQLPKVGLPAVHFYQNLLGAIACARWCGLSWEEIQGSVTRVKLYERRFQEVVKQGIIFIDDAYNAGEATMICALQSFAQRESTGKKIAILGELAELGEFSEETHRRVGLCALECVDGVICFGDGCKPIVDIWKKKGREAPLFLEMQEMIEHLKQKLNGGDLVLLKGSRGNRLERVLEAF